MTFNELHAALEFAYNGSLNVDDANAEEMKIKLTKLGMACIISEFIDTQKVQHVDKDVTSKKESKAPAEQKATSSQRPATRQSGLNKENVENFMASSPSVAALSPKWISKRCKNCKKTFFSARHHRKHENNCKKMSVGSFKKIF